MFSVRLKVLVLKLNLMGFCNSLPVYFKVAVFLKMAVQNSSKLTRGSHKPDRQGDNGMDK